MADGQFDLVTTAMFWHETSTAAMPRIMAEVHRVLAPGGLTLHLEQPQYAGMDPFEAFMRDSDAYNNNEPFWTRMHEADLDALVTASGFAPGAYFETTMQAKVDRTLFPEPMGSGASNGQEDYGRTPTWTAFGASKPASTVTSTVT